MPQILMYCLYVIRIKQTKNLRLYACRHGQLLMLPRTLSIIPNHDSLFPSAVKNAVSIQQGWEVEWSTLYKSPEFKQAIIVVSYVEKWPAAAVLQPDSPDSSFDNDFESWIHFFMDLYLYSDTISGSTGLIIGFGFVMVIHLWKI